MSDKQQDTIIRLNVSSGASYCIPDAHGHCITCSDEAVEVTVLSIDEAAGIASVRVQDAIEEVDISLLERIVPGDVLLVHGGVAIGHVDEAGNV